MIGGGWNLPPSYPNYCSTWVEITGTEGALILDDTQRDNWLNTVNDGQRVPDVDHAGRAGRSRVRRRDGAGDDAFPRGLHPRQAGDGDAGIARMVMETYTAADLSAERGEPVDLPLSNETISAVAEFKKKNMAGSERMKKSAKGIGLAIVGGGRVGLFRGEVANRHPAVEWIGLAEKNPNRAGEVAPKIGADFVTQSHVELLKRPEVTAAIISTDEHLHVDPIMAAVERGIPLLIEKPLATEARSNPRKVLKAIQDAKVDAVVGYTQRFRRHWLAGQGEVPHRRARRRHAGHLARLHEPPGGDRQLQAHRRSPTISPMVISGTHALDICMWYLEGKTPVEIYARSIDKVLGPLYQGIDATAGMIMFSDGTLYHLNISWALPVTWPAAVYSLEVGIIGTNGVLTIDDTHRDIVLAVSQAAVAKATSPTPRGWSTSWAAIRPATWRSANCAGRWRTRPTAGSTASRSACRPRRRRWKRRTAT